MMDEDSKHASLKALGAKIHMNTSDLIHRRRNRPSQTTTEMAKNSKPVSDFENLPLEVHEAIGNFVPRRYINKLCLTSRTLYQCYIKQLYHTFEYIRGYHEHYSLIQFFTTILRAPALAEYVQVLDMDRFRKHLVLDNGKSVAAITSCIEELEKDVKVSARSPQSIYPLVKPTATIGGIQLLLLKQKIMDCMRGIRSQDDRAQTWKLSQHYDQEYVCARPDGTDKEYYPDRRYHRHNIEKMTVSICRRAHIERLVGLLVCSLPKVNTLHLSIRPDLWNPNLVPYGGYSFRSNESSCVQSTILNSIRSLHLNFGFPRVIYKCCSGTRAVLPALKLPNVEDIYIESVVEVIREQNSEVLWRSAFQQSGDTFSSVTGIALDDVSITTKHVATMLRALKTLRRFRMMDRYWRNIANREAADRRDHSFSVHSDIIQVLKDYSTTLVELDLRFHNPCWTCGPSRLTGTLVDFTTLQSLTINPTLLYGDEAIPKRSAAPGSILQNLLPMSLVHLGLVYHTGKWDNACTHERTIQTWVWKEEVIPLAGARHVLLKQLKSVEIICADKESYGSINTIGEDCQMLMGAVTQAFLDSNTSDNKVSCTISYLAAIHKVPHFKTAGRLLNIEMDR